MTIENHEDFCENNVDGNKEASVKTIDAAINDLTNGDNGAHWEPGVIEAARELYILDRSLFQRKRSELKKASKDAQVTDWTKEIKGNCDGPEDSTKADEIVNMVKERSELFHNSAGVCFATFDHDQHTETWALGSVGFTDWIGFIAYSELGFSPSETAIKQSITALNGLAKYDGDECEVYLRCAPGVDGYIIDLCDEQWQSIKVTPSGWSLTDDDSVKFTRSGTATALPMPEKGDINLLWRHANIPEQQRALAVAFLLESWRPDTPFPVLVINGEQGSAKSSTHKRLRQLSDPNSIPLRVAPKTVEDVYVSAANNWQASFENMSNLSANMQDALCTLATGGGFASRKLYSDSEESVIEVKRPIIINSIVSVTTRPDLIDRTVTLTLPRIKSALKKRDAELDQAFDNDAPAIFGGLLDLFSATLRSLPAVKIKSPPRMIDFSYLGEAMLKSAGVSASFNELYKNNRRDNLANSLDSSPVALAVREMAQSRSKKWEGTVKQLKELIERHHRQDGEGWPKSPRGLSESLRRMMPALREVGVIIEFTKHGRDGNHLTVSFSESFSELENNLHHVHMFTNQPKSERVNYVKVKKESKKNHEIKHVSQIPEKAIPVSNPSLETII